MPLLNLSMRLFFDAVLAEWQLEAAVWDLDKYVASKTWQGPDPAHLMGMLRPFHLAWSASYYQTSAQLEPVVWSPGDVQLPLPW